jgi:two-component system copper resistance phosphate regulon response regulator CusR
MTILVIEDDRKTGDYLKKGLTESGYQVDLVRNGNDGLHQALAHPYELIVLDVMLPGIDGWQIMSALRAKRDLPVIFLTARDQVSDRIHGLELGADDYLVKPFSMKELVARVRAASRRATRREEAPRGEPIAIEELRIDPREVQAFVDGESAQLTPTEFRLLYQLALERGRVVTRDELLQKIWGRRETHRDRTVDVFVRRLRDKIDRRATRHTFIQTRYGVGYRLEPLSKD